MRAVKLLLIVIIGTVAVVFFSIAIPALFPFDPIGEAGQGFWPIKRVDQMLLVFSAMAALVPPAWADSEPFSKRFCAFAAGMLAGVTAVMTASVLGISYRSGIPMCALLAYVVSKWLMDRR